jgi:hypothetical protein
MKPKKSFLPQFVSYYHRLLQHTVHSSILTKTISIKLFLVVLQSFPLNSGLLPDYACRWRINLLWLIPGKKLDISVWKGIAQDALIMNIDDFLYLEQQINILLSSIGERNNLISADVISAY